VLGKRCPAVLVPSSERPTARARVQVTKQLRLVAEDDPWAAEPSFLLEVMLATYERRR
jgi:hypothetical protein